MKKVIAITLIAAQLTGCATMFGSGNNKSVKVTSGISNAKVYVDGKYYGGTTSGDTIIPLDGSEGHTITIEKAGYEPITMPVNRAVQGAYYFNIPLLFFFIIPGIVGFAVDGMTDNMYKYEPLYFSMQKNS